ncbi:concanavalin A-like lectin/glucanase domain-containing protein [Xylariales sp. PMI_506]|nr:concanavalin A-like lectin/glucanase domain-containing protein [Xylariales sp. PMI_506]
MAPRSLLASAALLAALLPLPVAAQLHTDCNPLNTTCPADAAFGTAHTFYFNSTPAAGLFNTTNNGGAALDYDSENGVALTIPERTYAPTLTTNFYIFGGKAEVLMKAANGTGIVSSIVLSSDDLDEVDWEFIGGDTAHAQTNYFGKGRTNSTGVGNGITYPVTGNVQTEWHNYTTIWTNTSLQWWIDGTLVRTLLPADANSTNNYPQTPMKLSIGIWAGGDPSEANGTIEWAGGETDYTQAPFTMYVKSAHIEDYSTGKSYSYSDHSGSWDSIKIAEPGSNSTAVTTIATAASDSDSSESISEKWAALPQTTKYGIYGAAGGVGALLIIALIAYYVKQRRRGRTEAALAAKRQEEDRLEMERFRKEGRDPDALEYEAVDYAPSTISKEAAITTTYNLPDSRNNSLRSVSNVPPASQSAWDPTGAGSPAMRSPMPLLQNGAQSPRMASPGPQSFNAPVRNNSYGPGSPMGSPMSPVRSRTPGAPQYPLPASPGPRASPGPGPRSFSSPNPNMRMGSPGPQAGGYGGMDRMNSPGPMQPPNRSYTAPRSPGGYGQQPRNNGYWNENGSGNF